MRESVYRARREMFKTLDIPATKADLAILKWKQRARLAFWEMGLRSLLVVKRAVDIMISVVALVLLSPLFLGVAICILIDDGFPVLLFQKRVGLYGREFRLLKFRSMCRDADEMKAGLMEQNESAGGIMFKMKNDPRITRVGRMLRRFSIDEMPQFLNVLVRVSLRVASSHIRIGDTLSNQIHAFNLWMLFEGPGQFNHILYLAAGIRIAAQLQILTTNQAMDAYQGNIEFFIPVLHTIHPSFRMHRVQDSGICS